MNRGNGGYVGILKEGLATYPFSGVYSIYDQHENKLYGSWLDKSDPNFANTTLLLKSNASLTRSTTAVDSSSNFTVTRVGTPSVGWTGPYQADGHWSGYFNGSSQLSIPNNAAFEIGAGDFSYEAFVYATQATNTYAQGIISYGIAGNTGASTCDMQISASGFFALAYATGAALTLTDPTSFPLNQWVHCVACRSGSTISLFVNGVRKAAATTSATVGTGGAMVIGCQWYLAESARQLQNGYISSVRVLKGASAYDATLTTLTVPTAPLTAITNTSLLTCQSNRFIDKGTANGGLSFTITPSGTPQATPYYYPSTFTAPTASPGAVLLNGTTDYFTAPNTSNGILDLSQRTVSTVECWVYPTSRNTGQATIAGTRMGAGGGWEFRINTNGTVQFYKTATGTSITSSATAPLYQWTFVATTQNGTALTLTVNSVSVSNATGGAGSFSSTTCGIGGDSLAVDAFPGYIANLRISTVVRIIAVPTTPLTTDANTSLLLNFAESTYSNASAAQNNTFIDTSPYAVTITRNGTPTQGSLTPYWPNGYWSNYFNGTNAYLTYNQTFALGTNDFTIELWLNIPVQVPYPSNYWLWGWRNGTDNCPALYLSSIPSGNGNLLWFTGNLGFMSNPNNIPLNTWTHIAIVRSGLGTNNLKMYINGVQVAQSSTTQSFTYTGTQPIGANPSGNGSVYYTLGYISNFRIVNSTAVYTGAFTPPTLAPLTTAGSTSAASYTSTTNVNTTFATSSTGLLTCQSNRFVDNSVNNFTFSAFGAPQLQLFQPFAPPTAYNIATLGGSGYFNGSTDYLSSPVSTSFALGTNNFTIEMWVYLLTASGGKISTSIGNFATFDPLIGYLSAGSAAFEIRLSSTGSSWNISDGSVLSYLLNLNSWNHIALVRNGSNIALYGNGSLVGSVTSSASIYQSGNYAFVGKGQTSFYFPGYISSYRFVNGTAVYTGAFTPPTSPLTSAGATSAACYPSTTNVNTSFNSASTSLLINFANAGIYDATIQNSLTAVGSAQGNTAAYKWLNSSVLFNGSTDYLTTVSNTAGILNFGTNPYTIEFWFYGLSKTTNQMLLRAQNATGSLEIFINTSGIITLGTQATSTYVTIPSANWTLSTWTHIAFVRAGTGTSQLTAYVNGTAVATGTDAFNYTITGIDIGAGTNYSGGYYLNGYMQDLRITKNVARYGTIPVPSETLTTVTSSSLLLKTGSAANGQQNNTFLDSGTANGGVGFTVTRNGTPLQGSLNPYWPNGYWSGYFNGSTDYLSSTTASTVLQFGTNPYTVEGWVYQTARSDTRFICGGAFSGNGFQANINASGYIAVGIPGFADLTASTIAISLNTWTHFAFVRTSTSTNGFAYYINGAAAGTITDANNYSGTATTLNVATTNNSALYMLTGYLSNLRIVKGIAVYTGVFTPPTAPLQATQIAGTNIAAITGTATAFLTCQSNRFKDNSTNNFAITVNGSSKSQSFQPFTVPPANYYTPATQGGNGYFNGSTDFLTVPANAAFSFGTGDFTIECWVVTTNPANIYGKTIVDARPDGVNGSYWIFGLGNTGIIGLTTLSTGGIGVYSPSAMPFNQWVHVAATRASGTINLWLNGVSVASATGNTDNMQSDVIKVGTNAFRSPAPETYYIGNLSDLRIVKGVAVYTGAFTPPTAPLTAAGATSAASYPSTTNVNTSFAAANTSLLLNFANAAIYDAAANHNVITVSNAQAGTAQFKWSPSSIFFNGGTSSLSIPSSMAFGFGTGDWTIEFWVYLNAAPPTNITLVSMLTNISGAGFAPHIYCATGGSVRYYTNSSDRITGGVLAATTWNYIVVAKASGSTKMYINGVQTGLTYTDANDYGTSNPFAVADYAVPLAGGTVNGYFQDVRITRGRALYTVNFTAPAAPFLTS